MPRTYAKAMKGRMVDFPDEMWEAIKVDAKAVDLSMGAFIRRAVSESLRPRGGLVTDPDHLTVPPPVADLVDPDFNPFTSQPHEHDLWPDPIGQPSKVTKVRHTKTPVPEPMADDGPVGTHCRHPNASRRQLSYGTFCDNCQDMVR